MILHELLQWPCRESNPGLRRERATSWPLDYKALSIFILVDCSGIISYKYQFGKYFFILLQNLLQWPCRESNPGLRRERATSWPLDYKAIWVEATWFEHATSASRTQRSTGLSHASTLHRWVLLSCRSQNTRHSIIKIPRLVNYFFTYNFNSQSRFCLKR